MAIEKIIYIGLGLILVVLLLSIFLFLRKIKEKHISRNHEKLGGTILLMACFICGVIGLYTFGDTIEGIIFSLMFFGISISPIAMILGKVNKS